MLRTEEDLYGEIRSAFDAGRNLLSNLFKSVEDKREEDRKETQGKGYQEWTTEFKDGSTKTVTRSEHVDETGAVYVKEVASLKNSEGVEVSRSVRHSIRAVHDEGKAVIDARDDAKYDANRIENEEGVKDGKDGKKSGWFWST